MTGITLFSLVFVSSCTEKEIEATRIKITSSVTGEFLVGETRQFEVQFFPAKAKKEEITWSIANEQIASITNNGLVSALSEGSTMINAVSKKGLTDSFFLTTKSRGEIIIATSIKITAPSSEQLVVGKTRQLNVTFAPTGAVVETINWTSSNPTTLEVSNTGLVKALAAGTTTISATSENGLTDSLAIVTIEKTISEDIKTDSAGNYIFDFYAVNDFHGALEAIPTNGEPGINKLAGAITTSIDENPAGSYVLSSGDMWQGSSDSNITRGSLVTAIMNELDFTSMTLGNHEFDWGKDALLLNKEQADFPFLACNIKNKSLSAAAGKDVYDTELADPYTIIDNEATGLKIGIIGAIGQGITSSILASQVVNYEFVDPTNLVIKYSNELRNEKDCDIIIYSYHHNGSMVDNQLAQYVDAVFCGHGHLPERETISSGGRTVPLIQSASNGKLLGKVELKVNPSSKVVTYVSHANIDVFNLNFDDNQEVAQIYDYYYETQIKSVKEEVIGYSSSSVSTTKILNFTLKEMLAKYHAIDPKIISAVHNSGGVRSSIPAGNITYGDVYKALPFDNNLYFVNFGTDKNAYNFVTQYNKELLQSGHTKSDLYSGQGYKMVTISYCFEKLDNYESYDHTILADFARDIVADALRAGRTF